MQYEFVLLYIEATIIGRITKAKLQTLEATPNENETYFLSITRGTHGHKTVAKKVYPTPSKIRLYSGGIKYTDIKLIVAIIEAERSI